LETIGKLSASIPNPAAAPITGAARIGAAAKHASVIGKVEQVAPAAPAAKNSHLAGQVHPSGVPFSTQGFPQFEQVSGAVKAEVSIAPTGSRYGDRIAAEKAAREAGMPTQANIGGAWHHTERTGVMQLVDTDLHRATGHVGGFSAWGRN
jgi:hypothetical protein